MQITIVNKKRYRMNIQKTLLLASGMALLPLTVWSQSQAEGGLSNLPSASSSWAGSYVGVSLGRSQGERRTVGANSSAQDEAVLTGSPGYCWNTANNTKVVSGLQTQESCINSGVGQPHVWYPGTPPGNNTNVDSASSEQTATRSRNTFGIKAGHNWQASGDRMVYGVEFDYTRLSDLNNSISTATREVQSGNASLTTSSKLSGGIDWLSTLRGRVGYASEDNTWLPYLTAGLAWGSVKTRGTATYSSNLSAGTTVNQHAQSDMKSGLVIGVGMDYRIDKNLVLNLSLMRAKLGDRQSFTDSVSNTATLPNRVTTGSAYGSIDPYVNLAAIGISYKFD